ncbi:hypothetical protein ACGF0J_16270 [Nonomuraea sp. NPDC047897]
MLLLARLPDHARGEHGMDDRRPDSWGVPGRAAFLADGSVSGR